MSQSPKLQLDHVVVAAASLSEGVAWCEATLGITPGPGGEHALFGTHNRLFKVASEHFPDAYFEIIAINPQATPARPGKRWFDLDDAALQARLKAHGPQLIHWVARTADLRGSLAAWRLHGVERGDALEASRPTPQGPLSWRISVRPDGQRLMHGCLPTVIEWGTEPNGGLTAAHPARTLPKCGVRLNGLALTAPGDGLPPALRTELSAASPAISIREGAWGLSVTLATPLGEVRLSSSSH
jgi:hypothetical protein